MLADVIAALPYRSWHSISLEELVMHLRKRTGTLVALLLSLCGCGKQEPAGSAPVKPPAAATTRSNEAKNPLAGLATKEGATLEGVNSKVRAVAFSPDGKTLAAGESKDISLWDLATGKKIGILKGHDDDSVTALAFSPDGKMLVSCGADILFGKNAKIKFWDVESKQDKGTLENIDLCTMLTFTPDGKTVWSNRGDNDGGGYGWDVETRKKQPALVGLRRQLSRNEARSYIDYAYSAGGDCLGASGVAPGEVFATVVEVPSRKQLADIPEFAGMLVAVSCVAKAILCQEAKTDKPSLWDFSGKKRVDLEGKLSSGSAFSYDGKYLAASMEDKQFKGVVQVWDVATGKPIVTLNDESEFYSVVFSKDGKLLAAGGDRGRIKMWTIAGIVK
jgi:WD40 repeat protein